MAGGCPSMCGLVPWLLPILLLLLLVSPSAECLENTTEDVNLGQHEKTMTSPTMHGISSLSETYPSMTSKLLNSSNTTSLSAALSSSLNATVPISTNASLSLSMSTEASLVISPSISPTPSLEEIPDNMYTRTESCDLPIVNKCAESFCNCISRGHVQIGKESGHVKNAAYRCRQPDNTNCYYHLYCARERVSCLWNAAFWYKDHYPVTNTFYGLSDQSQDDSMDERCIGLGNIYGNFSQITQNTNYYDTLFYSECVDYVEFVLRSTRGDICTTSIVPMYACGASLFRLPPTRQIHYTPLSKGTRRLVISVVARIVGNFTPVFAPVVNKNDERPHLRKEKLREAMYKCFLNVFGIDGVFSIDHADECLVMRYEVGVGEADPWVGDFVTANALNLMVRNTSWMEPAQQVINSITDSLNLTPPIVVHSATFEPGQGQPEKKLCDAGCAVALSLVSFLTLLAFTLSGLFCCRRPRQLYTIFEGSYDFDEEMENMTGQRDIRVKRK
ncbi:hypothetical protein TraAM80_01404 [Trypanosoma rangeli]|uniref:Uncharacterized protein n=1 Tax=Trypanosoma rangeli TaxID=5698 RepID=A0A422NZ18_TRYRA|nr:uncharacterized protein TraAM80_01404 [Trypanosoma rangeli]RNF10700.1 hypothetical protein TraAM80_01404 [Trypanosoma rangeli]|eukprot:RNF10700.1 hypothetical protein TraAM80_01404 [Trypanosoma rangeli]